MLTKVRLSRERTPLIQASGVQVSDEVKTLFDNMKVHHKGEEECNNCKVAIMMVHDDCIVLKEKHTVGDIRKKEEDPFMVVKNALKPNDCCYLLYDCCFDTNEVPHKEEMIFIMWVPSGARIKQKMVYASSKAALKAVFTGIKYDLEVHDSEEICDRRCFAEHLGKDVTSIEGISIGCNEQQHHAED